MDAAHNPEPGPSSGSVVVEYRKDGGISRMRSHKGNVPQLPQTKLCPYCPAKFTRTTHLNRHLRNRESRRPPRCPPRPHRPHRRADTNERLYRCEVSPAICHRRMCVPRRPPPRPACPTDVRRPVHPQRPALAPQKELRRGVRPRSRRSPRHPVSLTPATPSAAPAAAPARPAPASKSSATFASPARSAARADATAST